MEDEELKTVKILDCVARHRNGDPRGMHELICRSSKRLEKIARKMLRAFPYANKLAQSEDVLQEALIKLSNSLHEVTPKNVPHFFNLAASKIRFQLLDLTREYRRRFGTGMVLSLASADEGSRINDLNPGDGSFEIAEELERWEEFHRAVDMLEGHPRRVFQLTYYGGWNQIQVSELLGCSERQTRRYLGEASEQIRAILGRKNLPSP